ncbi:MAG: 4Fe-4S binding protein [Bacteroidetes bacterium]|nr:MAG: 4Fe-4S binding protein [Bacteroidota bacterium]
MIWFHSYNARRRLIQVLSAVVFITLPFGNILRLDIPTLRFYAFNTVLWIDEFYLLFLVLMLIIFIIVIFSMIYGRVWCGWMCPQTGLNELVSWYEKKTKQWLRVPKTGASLIRRATAGVLQILTIWIISFLIGFVLIAYFVDPYTMVTEISGGTLGVITTGILVGISALTFVNIMFWREKFCTKACPYGMMQMVITDSRTQIVRYRTERNDDCIECKACVRDCMMGIDIRTSPYQTECIHCGVCVDSCTAILSRLQKPTLISFSWGEQQTGSRWFERLGFIDAKRWIIAFVVVAYAVVLAVVIHTRQPLALTASGDRSTLFREGKDGLIYNDYVVKISNRSMEDGLFKLDCNERHTPYTSCSLFIAENPIRLKSREEKTLKMSISTNGQHLKPGPNRLELQAVHTSNSTINTTTEIVFFMPEEHSGNVQ